MKNTNNNELKPIKGLKGYYWRCDGVIIGRWGREIHPDEYGVYSFRKHCNVYHRHIDVVRYSVYADVDLFTFTPRHLIKKIKSEKYRLKQIADISDFLGALYVSITEKDRNKLIRHLYDRYYKDLKRYFKYHYREIDDDLIDGFITDSILNLSESLVFGSYACFAPMAYLINMIGHACYKEKLSTNI